MSGTSKEKQQAWDWAIGWKEVVITLVAHKRAQGKVNPICHYWLGIGITSYALGVRVCQNNGNQGAGE